MSVRPPTALAICLVSGLVALSCRDLPAGPSLADVVIRDLSLRSTAGNDALCCCQVAATAENHNSVTVHLTMKFSAFDGQAQDPVATILHSLFDVAPGETRSFNAAGFIFPCSVIRDVKTEIDVKGLSSPPG